MIYVMPTEIYPRTLEEEAALQRSCAFVRAQRVCAQPAPGPSSATATTPFVK